MDKKIIVLQLQYFQAVRYSVYELPGYTTGLEAMAIILVEGIGISTQGSCRWTEGGNLSPLFANIDLH